jgi:hypothetical protein
MLLGHSQTDRGQNQRSLVIHPPSLLVVEPLPKPVSLTQGLVGEPHCP